MRGTSNVPGHPVSELLQTANRATHEALLLHVCCSSNGCGHHRRNDHGSTGTRSSSVPSRPHSRVSGMTDPPAFNTTDVSSHQSTTRYRHGQSHIRRRLGEALSQSGSGPRLPGQTEPVYRSGLRLPPTRELLAKQQLFAILAILLEHVINSLGQFVRNDVVDHHLPRAPPVPLQLPLIVAPHPRIATHRMHGRLR